MFNNPPPEERKPHPLERDPQRPPDPKPQGEPQSPPRQRLTLHIPTVKPYVTYAIIVVNVLIFLIRIISRELDTNLVVWGANNARDVLQDGQLYRLFTSMFLHASIYTGSGGFALQNSLHLIFNMYILYLEGTRTEQMFGHVRFAIVYFLGGLAGSVLSTAFSDPNAYSLGASGAVFAVMGAQIVFLYKHRKLFGASGRAEMSRIVQLVAINIGFGLLTALGSSAFGRIDNWAHIGGALGGAALAWAISPFFVLQSHPDQINHVVADDINPLRNHYRELTLFSISLMGVLLLARVISI